ncbi:heparinase II/III family protein [Paenibacillus sp. PAMC21692]|uniref:heparinase II/III domain-containing protein n=1 Tax=Paenibacillus sp. PAMC21692 TaxID=2762320 RepID=UPI00164DE9F5|nr:heparinase II/III family protein [Paenibacillus sp. PAMC21692]QNK54421.1 alginate lyase family protein [Paenibacillus sp. PAMC21692]
MSAPKMSLREGKDDTLGRLVSELDAIMAANPEIPTEPGGWWHQYVCPEHHTELLFDELKEDDGRYECPHGCVMEGEPYHGAWLVFRHQAMARFALKASAVFAATGERRYGEYGKGIIAAYAKQFPLYPVHPDAQPWMLKGRAFHQALTEAIWATTLLRAYVLLKDNGLDVETAQDDFNKFLDMLGSSMEQYHHILTVERNQPENNYTAWLNAALCCVYASSGDEVKLRSLLERKGGLLHHLEIAIQADGLEFEGSVYYHVFVLRAYMIAAEMATRFGIDLYAIRGQGARSMEGMLDVLTKLADERGWLPALHDGPYGRAPYSREIVEIFEIGYTKYRKPDYKRILAFYYKELNPGSGQRDGLEYMLYGYPWDPSAPPNKAEVYEAGGRSCLLPDSGFAVLRHPDNQLSALVDYGPHGGSHGHYDKLNLMLSLAGLPLSPDPGTVPYGSELKKGWYPSTPCHNTVSVNRRSQNETAGRCLSYSAHDSVGTFISMVADDAYEGAELKRHVAVVSDYVIDWMQVRLQEEGELDWWFHFLGEPEAAGEESLWERMEQSVSLGDRDGYQYIKGIGKLRSEAASGIDEYKYASFRIRSTGDSMDAEMSEDYRARKQIDRTASISLMFPSGSTLWQVESPGTATDPSMPMNGVMVRHVGIAIDLVAVYRAGAERAAIRWSSNNDNGSDSGNRVLVVTTEAGCRTYELTENGLKEGETDL